MATKKKISKMDRKLRRLVEMNRQGRRLQFTAEEERIWKANGLDLFQNRIEYMEEYDG